MTEQYIDIARGFKVNPDSCDNPNHYESYIVQDCFSDYIQGMGVTHAFVFGNKDTGEKKMGIHYT